MKKYPFIILAMCIVSFKLFSQATAYDEIEYSIIAEGLDSPFANEQIVCFNRYFNLEQLPTVFRDKYDLANQQLFKKKMLVQLFYKDADKKGLDKFEINDIKENSTEIIFDYSILNSDKTNDSTVQSPFIIVQIPKNTKKRIRFIANGVELGNGKDLYIDN